MTGNAGKGPGFPSGIRGFMFRFKGLWTIDPTCFHTFCRPRRDRGGLEISLPRPPRPSRGTPRGPDCADVDPASRRKGDVPVFRRFPDSRLHGNNGEGRERRGSALWAPCLLCALCVPFPGKRGRGFLTGVRGRRQRAAGVFRPLPVAGPRNRHIFRVNPLCGAGGAG